MRAVAVFNTYASAYKLRFNNITMRLQNANKLRNRSHSSAQRRFFCARFEFLQRTQDKTQNTDVRYGFIAATAKNHHPPCYHKRLNYSRRLQRKQSTTLFKR